MFCEVTYSSSSGGSNRSAHKNASQRVELSDERVASSAAGALDDVPGTSSKLPEKMCARIFKT